MAKPPAWARSAHAIRRRFRQLVPKRVRAHPTLWQGKLLGSNLVAREIAHEISIRVFDNGADRGYHPYSNAWWTNVRCPYAFQYPNIDGMYEQAYYSDPATSHPDDSIARDLYGYM